MSRATTGLAGSLAGLGCLLLLTGCGSATPATLSGATSPVTAPATSPVPVTTDPVPVPSDAAPVAGAPAAPAAATTAPCTAAVLRTTVGAAGGAAGHDALPVHLTNTGAAACTVTGHPTVHLLAAADRAPVGHAAAAAPGPAPVVRLAPGGSATATLSIARAGLYDPADCTPVPAAALSVVAPGGGAADVVRLDPQVDACSTGGASQVSVTALAPGSGS